MDATIGVIFVFFGLILLGFYLFSTNHQFYCKNCHATGETKNQYAFGGFAELLIWLVFITAAIMVHWLAIIPAILLSIWRISSKKQVCGSCNSADVVPANSPAATELAKNNETATCPFCAETIKKSAIICKHCSKDLSPQA